jgi:hypothetical protein
VIKDVWATPVGPRNKDLFTVSIRFEPDTQIYASVTQLPPGEDVNGKKLSLPEAVDLGIDEPHLLLGSFTREDLDNLISELMDLRSDL